MTIDACPAGKEAVALPLAIETEGVALLSRKPDGYEIVMVDEAAKLVAQTKLTITETPVFMATLSDGATNKDTMVT